MLWGDSMPKRRGKYNQFSNEINKQVKRYNEKIKQIKNKYPELKNLYKDSLKSSELKDVILTAKDLKKLTSSIDKLFISENIKPITTKSGITLNKWAIDEYNKDVKIVNKLKLKELDIMLKTPFKGTEFSYAQMGGDIGNELRPINKKYNEYDKVTDFRKMLKSVQFRSFPSYSKYRNNLYKDNFIKSLYQVGNEYIDEYGNIQTIDLKDVISKIPAEKFIDFLRNIGEDLHLILNENYTVLQQRERLTELVELVKGFGVDVV